LGANLLEQVVDSRAPAQLARVRALAAAPIGGLLGG
jgi:hypothetical protein